MEEQSIVDYVAERVAPHKKLEQGVRLLSFPPSSDPAPLILLPSAGDVCGESAQEPDWEAPQEGAEGPGRLPSSTLLY